jgi:hypothetical protein
MTPGVWIVPLVIVALVVFLWASTWLEDHVAPPGYDPELPTLEGADTAFADMPPTKRGPK